MSLECLINENQPALFALIGAILGFFVNQLTTWISKAIDHRYNVKIKRLDIGIELEKKYLIEPVVSFIDKDLKSMQKLYAQLFKSKEEKACLSLDNEYVFELSSVQARVRGLGDESLNAKFEEFSRARISIGTEVSDADSKAAYTKLDEAIKLAGAILELLFKKLRKIEN